MLQVISDCFSKLALLPEYHGQWRTGDQWVAILVRRYKDELMPILQQKKEFNELLIIPKIALQYLTLSIFYHQFL